MTSATFKHPWAGGRRAGIAATLVVHAMLLLAWQARRPTPAVVAEPRRMTVQWIRLPAPAVQERPARPPVRMHPVMPVRPPAPFAPVPVQAVPTQAAPPAGATLGVDAPALSAPSAGATLLERARRAAGAVDRALRKENYPYIVAPLDSPEIRMRKKMERAAELAPNRLWEAPKMEELVNDSGDGARRTRVITPAGAYCITERAPTTSIDMIEKHGKIRTTDCGTGHEQPASSQEWRTARD
jgi:hypothetical protein